MLFLPACELSARHFANIVWKRVAQNLFYVSHFIPFYEKFNFFFQATVYLYLPTEPIIIVGFVSVEIRERDLQSYKIKTFT